MKRIRNGDCFTGMLFILPSLLGISIFVLVPFIDVVIRSFENVTGKNFVGFKNYSAVFRNGAFILAGENTLKFVGICIPLLIGISLLAALLIDEGVAYAGLLKSAYLIPMAIPVASVVLVWKVLFHEQGITNGVLSSFSIQGVDWMNTNAAFAILVGSYIWKNLGYNVVLWVAGLNGIPETVHVAAKVDGAGWWQRFIYITMPNLKPTLCTIVILAFLNSFKVFREAYLVSGDYPNDSIYMLQHLFNNWFRELSLDKLSAAAVAAAIVIFTGIMILQKVWDIED
jgi:multiple sugar transport system permease protein